MILIRCLRACNLTSKRIKKCTAPSKNSRTKSPASSSDGVPATPKSSGKRTPTSSTQTRTICIWLMYLLRIVSTMSQMLWKLWLASIWVSSQNITLMANASSRKGMSEVKWLGSWPMAPSPPKSKRKQSHATKNYSWTRGQAAKLAPWCQLEDNDQDEKNFHIV